MKKVKYLLIIILLGGAPYLSAQSILYKIRDKAEDKAIDKIFKEDKKGNENSNSKNESTKQSTTKNTKGGGLSAETIDIKQYIADAGSSFDSKNYGSAKNSVMQAMRGIEIEMGKGLLASLPSSIDGLDKDESQDLVTSTGIGFVGLSIERTYLKNDKELSFNIVNNGALLTATNLYLSGAYATSEEDVNRKQITYKGYKSLIEYDENDGYSLTVPFGQSSVLVLKGINFSNEKELISAADKFDLEKIKSTLGEK